MALVKRRVVNPTPSILALVNGRKTKRGKTMAARKRKRTTRRRARARANPINPVNPTRRRSTKRRGRRSTVYARRRNPINPARRRRYGRRRARPNPAIPGGEILNFTVAGLAQGIAAPIIGGFAGRFLPFGQYNPPIITAGTGWLLSKGFELFGFTRRFSRPALIFGFAAAAMQILQPIVARTLGNGMGRRGYGNGMRGIAAVHGVPPHLLAPPPIANNGVRGIAAAGAGWGR